MELVTVVIISVLLAIALAVSEMQSARDRKSFRFEMRSSRNLAESLAEEAKLFLNRTLEIRREMDSLIEKSAAQNLATLESIQDALKQSSADPAKTEELLKRVDILISEIEGENEDSAKTQKVFAEGLQNLMNYDIGTARAANKQ